MERRLLRKVPLSKYQILEESALPDAIQKKCLFIRIAFITKRLEFALNNKWEMTLIDWFSSHIWWWIDWRSHVSVLCNLIQIYWNEGTYSFIYRCQSFFTSVWINKTLWDIISSTCRKYTSTFPIVILWNSLVLKMKGQKTVKKWNQWRNFFPLQLKFQYEGNYTNYGYDTM